MHAKRQRKKKNEEIKTKCWPLISRKQLGAISLNLVCGVRGSSNGVSEVSGNQSGLDRDTLIEQSVTLI